MSTITRICSQFNLSSEALYDRPLTGGRINDTYLVDLADGSSVIAQRINRSVVTHPDLVMHNVAAVTEFLGARGIRIRFPEFLDTRAGGNIYSDENGDEYRVYRYIDGETLEPGQANSAAMLGLALGAFHRSVNDFPVEKLGASIEHYHNTPRYFENFARALASAPTALTNPAPGELSFLEKQRQVCSSLLELDLPARVAHNDTKLENMLVDRDSGVPIGFVDCDTLMPGLLAFDFGDGARSVCKNCRTDERDLSKVKFRLDLFDEYAKNFIAQARSVMESSEPASLALGAVVMALELGIRYMTDYLSGNTFFKIEYPAQNLDRARVQLIVCLQMQKSYADMCAIVKKYLTA